MDEIDLYCERVGAGIFQEPLNVLSNLAFFISAFALWQLAKREHNRSKELQIFIASVALVGLGSSIFHLFGTRSAAKLDIYPILFSQLFYLWLYAKRVANVSTLMSFGILAAFYLLSAPFKFLGPYFNGSVSYLPVLVALIVMGIYHRMHNKVQPELLFKAAGIFALSLMFRTIDNELCELVSIGTHFFWHILNGVMFFQLGRVLIVSRK